MDYDWGDLIDNPDRLRTLIDPASAYSVNAAMAMGRAMDDEIIAAATGNAFAGKTGGTTTALPSGQTIATNSNSFDVDSNTQANNQPLTVGKLIEARKILGAADADDYDVNGNSNLFLVVNAQQLGFLLTSTKVNSADFNQIRALVAGDLNQYMDSTSSEPKGLERLRLIHKLATVFLRFTDVVLGCVSGKTLWQESQNALTSGSVNTSTTG